jgi:protein SCO1
MNRASVLRTCHRSSWRPAGLAAVLWSLTLAVPARADVPPPPAVREIGIDEHSGQTIPGQLEFTDQAGRRVRLSELFQDDKPVLLILAYFRCPALCGLILRGVVHTLSDLGWTPGAQYRAVTVSIDPKDTAATALSKHQSILGALKLARTDSAWPFLVGSEPDIQALTSSVGYRYAYDPASDQYAHPAVLVILTPRGKISRYLYGVEFPASDLRLALLEASEGRIGTVLDRVIMTCYRYDPATRRYGPYVFGFLRIGSALILAGLAVGMSVLLWRQRARKAGS